ncbi:DUF6318 family protein [Arthrobacter sp. RAF14]|uniref:DUF6318 family protein n=1 Tax=Arthrobacter sp. RAF14 TaxID=3233051 RepID=UPI003F938326
MKRVVSWCVLVALSCVGLVACGTGPAGPSLSPPPTTTATAVRESSSPSPVVTSVYKPATATSKAQNVPVPVMPEAAKKETPEGAKAFVGYWVAMLSYAYETGDVKTLDTLGAPGCRLCHSQPTNIASEWSNGAWTEGGKLRIPHFEIKATPYPSRVTLVAQIDQDAIKVHDRNGKITASRPKATTAVAFVVDYSTKGWGITDSKRWVGE